MHDPSNPLEFFLYKTSDCGRHVVCETGSNGEFVATAGSLLTFKDKARPSWILLLIVHGPETAATGALFNLDSFSRLDIKQRTGGKRQGHMRIQNKP